MKSCVLGAMALAAVLAAPAYAGEEPAYLIVLKDHVFSPAVLELPADRKVKVTIRNADDSEAEFESNSLNREKVLAPKSEITVFLGPLKPGTYEYFDDLHMATPTATIEVK